MQKPLTFHRQGLLAKNSITRILAQSPTKNQVVSELSSYITSGALTNALEFLEKYGITGDVALFIVASLQSLEVEA